MGREPTRPERDQVAGLSPNRALIYDLMTRAKRFHCPVTSSWQFEVSALEAAQRATLVDGRPIGITAVMARATSLVLARYPHLNRHIFHGLLRTYEVSFADISCNLVVGRRGRGREKILLPLVLEKSDQLSAAEIQAVINHHRSAPLEELPQFAALERVKRLPRFLLRWFSFRVRSSHTAYRKHFGTFGLSSMPASGATAHALHTIANTCVAFLIGGVRDAPVVREGQLAVGRVLHVACVADHYLLDGMDVLQAMRYLGKLLADPARLGLTLPEDLPAPAEPVASPSDGSESGGASVL